MKRDSSEIKLVIDGRMYFSSGIGTVLQNLIPRFAKSGFALTLLLREEDLGQIHLPKVQMIPMKSRVYSLEEQLELFRKVPECDLFWSPHYNIPLLPVRARKRVVTIHDVCHLALLKNFSSLQRLYARRMLHQAISRSDLVLVNSDFTENEIGVHLKRRDEKIKRIYFGVDQEQFSPVSSGIDEEAKMVLNLPKSYFLFVGNLKPHKNLSLLVDAFEKVAATITSDLVIVGAKEQMITIDEMAEKKAKSSPFQNRIHFLGRVSQKYLPSLYRCSKALVFPSFYEGFGFPALEAMQCGTLVLASKIGALEEVCKEAALYFDPHDAKSLGDLFLELEGKVGQDLFLERGRERLLHFDWDQTALCYAEEMRGILT